jgi:hypothetical protein
MGRKAARLRFAVEVGWKRPFTSIGAEWATMEPSWLDAMACP